MPRCTAPKTGKHKDESTRAKCPSCSPQNFPRALPTLGRGSSGKVLLDPYGARVEASYVRMTLDDFNEMAEAASRSGGSSLGTRGAATAMKARIDARPSSNKRHTTPGGEDGTGMMKSGSGSISLIDCAIEVGDSQWFGMSAGDEAGASLTVSGCRFEGEDCKVIMQTWAMMENCSVDGHLSLARGGTLTNVRAKGPINITRSGSGYNRRGKSVTAIDVATDNDFFMSASHIVEGVSAPSIRVTSDPADGGSNEGLLSLNCRNSVVILSCFDSTSMHPYRDGIREDDSDRLRVRGVEGKNNVMVTLGMLRKLEMASAMRDNGASSGASQTIREMCLPSAEDEYGYIDPRNTEGAKMLQTLGGVRLTVEGESALNRLFISEDSYILESTGTYVDRSLIPLALTMFPNPED